MSDHGHPIVARLYDPVMAGPEQTIMVEHREFLAGNRDGVVLDLGAGTGAMFPYFEGTDVEVHALEPDPHMREQARERAAELDVDVTFVDAGAEDLPFDDATFDTVIASLVFCSIPDPEAALDEVARVLGPDGDFRFIEHVRARGAVGRLHDAAAPAWHAVAGGCHLNRETGDLFQAHDHFEVQEFERFEGSIGLMPMIRGRLRKTSPRGSRFDRLFDFVRGVV
jgi:SAM-dependent methyltransferase